MPAAPGAWAAEVRAGLAPCAFYAIRTTLEKADVEFIDENGGSGGGNEPPRATHSSPPPERLDAFLLKSDGAGR